MESANFKSNLNLLFDDIKNIIESRFTEFIKEKTDLENVILQLPIVKNVINENKILLKKIKILEIKLLENNIEMKIDKKMHLEISELPKIERKKNVYIDDDKYNNSKKTNTIYPASLWEYNNSSSEDSDTDLDEETKPIVISEQQNYSSLLNDLTLNIKSKKLEKKNEKEVLLDLIKSDNENENQDDISSEYVDPQMRQLNFLNITKLDEKQDNQEDKRDLEEEEEGEVDEEEEEEEVDEEEEEEEEVDEEEEEDEVDEEEEEEEVDEEEEEVEEEEEEVDEEEEEEEEDEVDEEEEEDEVDEEEVEEEEVDLDDGEVEDDEEEDEEEEVEEIEIDGIKYYTTNSINGTVYEFLENEDIGNELGNLQNGVLFLS